MAPLLEALMRRYTGLFSYPVPIEEDYIAAKCGIPVSRLRQLLYQLALEHVIKYIPADTANVVYLHHDRLQPGNVQLSPKRYEMLKGTFRGRMQTMLDYAAETEECRSRFLLRYFGQADSLPVLRRLPQPGPEGKGYGGGPEGFHPFPSGGLYAGGARRFLRRSFRRDGSRLPDGPPPAHR